MKFVKRLWVKWDRKWDFWGNFGRVPRGNPRFWVSKNRGLAWRAVSAPLRASDEQHLLFCTFQPFGVFLDIPKCSSYVVLMNLSWVIMFTWDCMNYVESRRTLEIYEHDFWDRIKVTFFSNEMLLLWFNYCEYEYRRSMKGWHECSWLWKLDFWWNVKNRRTLWK